MEELKRLKPSEIKRKLRQLGIAPEDHPQCVEKQDLINLYLVGRWVGVEDAGVGKERRGEGEWSSHVLFGGR